MAKRKRKPRGDHGKTITAARKETRIRQTLQRGHRRKVNRRSTHILGDLKGVSVREIVPQTLEQLRRFNKKIKDENPWVRNINNIFNCGKFPITELMEKPIKMTSGAHWRLKNK